MGTNWVYAFAEGSREQRDLLGGKGANVAEMTRRARRRPRARPASRSPPRPASPTCATGALPRRARRAGATTALGAPRGRTRASALGDAERPAAGLRALGRARVDAGDARHRPQPRAQRRVGGGARASAPATSASRGTPTGASCRCSATSCAASRASASRTRSRAAKAARGVALDTELDVDALRELTARFQAISTSFPAGSPTRASSSAGDPRGLRLVDGRARRRLPAHQPHPRRLGHGGQRPADGLRQQGRDARARASRSAATRSPARPSPRGDFLVERPGRGRRLRRAQHRATSPSCGDVACRRSTRS